MTSPCPLESKISGAASSATRGLSAGAFELESVAQVPRMSADVKRSFARMLGQAEKEKPLAPRDAPAVKLPQGKDAPHQVQQEVAGVKSKFSNPARPPASEARAQRALDSEGGADNTGEAEAPAKLPAEPAATSQDAEHAASFVPTWVPPPLPIEEVAPVSSCAFEVQFGSAPFEAGAMALAITPEASPTSGDEAAGASNQGTTTIGHKIPGGREAAEPAGLVVARPRHAEGGRLHFNEAAEGKAGNAEGKRSVEHDEAGAFKLTLGLNSGAAQLLPTVAAGAITRSVRAEKTAAPSSTGSVSGDESIVSGYFQDREKNSNQAVKQTGATTLANTPEASLTSGDEAAGASNQGTTTIGHKIPGGREAAEPAGLVAARPRQAEGKQSHFNEAAEGEAGKIDGERAVGQDEAGAFKFTLSLNSGATQLRPTMDAGAITRSVRAEKTAAPSSTTSAGGDESLFPNYFNNIEKTINQSVKKSENVVGLTNAWDKLNMSSSPSDFSAASPADAPAADAVTRVNLVQVVDEVTAITEKMRVSGQQRCVVDIDVTGHGKIRVEVVRRADQVETVLSTDSASLRESLQAALDRAERPTGFSTSLQWQGSPDNSGRGQNGAQADADARQNMYFKAESALRAGRAPSLPVVPIDPIEAPVLTANHRLQIFA